MVTYQAEYWVLIHVFQYLGQENKEGWCCWQVWYPLWCLLKKDCQEDGNNAARQIYLHILRKGNTQKFPMNLNVIYDEYTSYFRSSDV